MARPTSQTRSSCWSWGTGVCGGRAVRRDQERLDSVSSTTRWGDGLHMSGEEERGEGNPEDTPRALSWANWLHGRIVLTQGNQRDLLDCRPPPPHNDMLKCPSSVGPIGDV